MPPRLWIDVEDLFEYARANARPSGIQRFAFEIYAALAKRDADRGEISFVRHEAVTEGFYVVAWSDIGALFARLTQTQAEPATSPIDASANSLRSQIIRKLVQRFPSSIRPLVVTLLLTNMKALRAWGQLVTGSVRAAWNAARSAAKRRKAMSQAKHASRPVVGASVSGGISAAAMQPGDIILVLGSPWFHPDYGSLIRKHKQKYGLRFALLVYDIIPLRRPEWCDSRLVQLFREWLNPILPLCDQIFAISLYTAKDVERYLAELGVALTRPVIRLPIGTGFNAGEHHVDAAPMALTKSERPLPLPGTYALIVSTIEARKNHILLFRIWRQLLEELPIEQVPTLVFAGRVGWLVDDLMRQIANTRNLGGKLVIVENPSDAELVLLYQGCLFTLFPSLYEGWGLPVTESLMFGKPCIISNRTSLPEAGGALARTFDPDNLSDAYRVISEAIKDRADLARWDAQVKRDFRPVSWTETAEALLAGLGKEDVLF